MICKEGEDDSPSYFIYLDQDSDVPPDVRHVHISDSITKIPEDAFLNCRELETLLLPSNGLVEIGAYAFYGCNSLRLIKNWPPSLKVIGGYAFYECTSLVSFPSTLSLREIGDYAFFGCISLTSIRIRICDELSKDDSNDKKDEQIGGDIESDNDDLQREESRRQASQQDIDGYSIDDELSKDDSNGKKDEPRQEIGGGIGSDGDDLQREGSRRQDSQQEIDGYSINDTSRWQESGQESFYSATGSHSPDPDSSSEDEESQPVVFEDDDEDVGKAEQEDQNTVENEDDKKCDNISDSGLSQKTATEFRLGEWVFRECTSLTHVEFVGNVSRILSGTFYGCSELLCVWINTLEIGAYAFDGCHKLQLLELPSSTVVATTTFDNCKMLEAKLDNSTEYSITSLLMNRFANLPIHTMCYKHKKLPQRELQQKWIGMKCHFDENDKSEDGGNEKEETAFELKDIFGLTPLHILIMIATRSDSENCQDDEVLSVKSEDAPETIEDSESEDTQDGIEELSSDVAKNYDTSNKEEKDKPFLLIEWLVKNYPSLLEKPDDCGLLPIHYAIYLAKNDENHLKIIKILLENWKSFPDRSRRIRATGTTESSSLLLYALKQKQPPPMVTLVYLYAGEPISPDTLLLSNDSNIQELAPRQKLSFLMLFESIKLQYLQHYISQSTESKSWLTPYLQHGWVQFVKMDHSDSLSPVLHQFLWNECLDSSFLESYEEARDLCQNQIMNILRNDASRLQQLAFARNHCGRYALSVEGTKISKALRERLLWMGRYQLVRPLYESAGTIVLEAKDYHLQDYCQKQWDHYFSTADDNGGGEEKKEGDEDTEQLLGRNAFHQLLLQMAVIRNDENEDIVNGLFQQAIASQENRQSLTLNEFTDFFLSKFSEDQHSTVALKFTKHDFANYGYLLRRGEKGERLDANYFVTTIQSSRLDLACQNVDLNAFLLSRNVLQPDTEYKYFHVMPLGISITNIGRMIRRCMKQVGEALVHLHETHGVYHNALTHHRVLAFKHFITKTSSVRLLMKWKYSTFDDNGASEPNIMSSKIIPPPEFIYCLDNLETYRQYKDYYGDDDSSGAIKWNTKTKKGYVLKRFHSAQEDDAETPPPYEPITAASPILDIWSFGLLAYRFAMGRDLFSHDMLEEVHIWGTEEEVAKRRLREIPNVQLREFLAWILHPSKRPKSMRDVLNHKYFCQDDEGNEEDGDVTMYHLPPKDALEIMLWKMQPTIFYNTMEVSYVNNQEIRRKMEHSISTRLMQMTLKFDEAYDEAYGGDNDNEERKAIHSMTPTCFVLLPRIISKESDKEGAIDESEEKQKNSALMKYIQNMLDFMTEWIMEPKNEILESATTMMLALLSSSDVQFHLIDELTLRPTNNEETSNYPLSIEPAKGVAALFPIMTRAFQLLSKLGAIEDSSDLIKMFVPCKEDEIVFSFPAEVLKKAEKFIQISKEIELVDNMNSAWKDYCHWLQENDPKFTFSQLCRVVHKHNSNSCAIWTSLPNAKRLQTEDEPPVMAYLRQQVDHFETKYHEATNERDKANKNTEKMAGQRDAARQALVKIRMEINDTKKKLEETQLALQETKQSAEAATKKQRKAQTELENAYKNLSDTRNQLKETARKLLEGAHIIPQKQKNKVSKEVQKQGNDLSGDISIVAATTADNQHQHQENVEYASSSTHEENKQGTSLTASNKLARFREKHAQDAQDKCCTIQ